MAVQTNYPSNQPAAVAGAQATEIPATIISRTVETAAGIGFGKPVAQGAADKSVVAYAGSGFVGITLLDRSATGVSGNPDAFPQYASARVITKGDVWVVAGAAVTAGQPVYLTAAGVFTNVATDNAAIAGARWDTSAASGALAVVRLA